MNKSRSRFFNVLKWVVLTALIAFIAARGYFALTDDFRLANITHPMPYEKTWEVSSLSSAEEQHLNDLLQQPFTYIGKGAQSYVFESQDGKYVLKFFKFKHLRPSIFLDSLPSIGYLKTYKEKQAARKQRKLFGVFNAYKLAYDVDKKESGLVFIQLNVEGNPQRSVTIIDKIGIQRTIDLQHYPFILQEKGETLRVVIDRLLKNGDVEMAKKRLNQILDMYAQEYQKGIYDHDHGVMQNTGFIDDRPIHLDVGKLTRKEEMRQTHYAKQDAQLVIDKMKAWVKRHYPQYDESISQNLDDHLEKLFQPPPPGSGFTGGGSYHVNSIIISSFLLACAYA